MIDKLDKKLRRMRRYPKIIDSFINGIFFSLSCIYALRVAILYEKIPLVMAIALSVLLISVIGMILTFVIKLTETNKLFEEYTEITVREGEFRELLFFAPNVTFLQGPDIDDKVLIIGVSGTSIEKYEMSKETAKKIFCDLTED